MSKERRVTMPRAWGARWTVAVAVAALVVAACGDDGAHDGPMDVDGGLPDAGPPPVPDGGPLEVEAPALPEIPWLEAGEPDVPLPQLAPCPEGWREETREGLLHCEPWPATGRVRECPIGEAHLPGRPGCEPIGDPCAEGFPEAGDVPEGVARYFVQAGSIDGDGSRDTPYGTLAEALDAAATAGDPEAFYLLGEGTYAVDRAVPGGSTFRGLCPARTTVVPADSFVFFIAFSLSAGQVAFEALSLDARGRIGLLANGAGVEVRLGGVEMRGAAGAGLVAGGGAVLDARGLVVRTVVPNVGLPGFGVGIQAQVGGTVELDRTVVLGVAGNGIGTFQEGATLTARRTVVADSRSTVFGLGGGGAFSNGDASLDLEEVVLEDLRGAGVYVDGTGRARIHRSVIREVQPQDADGLFGSGVAFVGGSRLEVQRTLVENTSTSAIIRTVADGTPFEATVEDVIARGVRADAVGNARGGLSFEASSDADVTVARVAIGTSAGTGLSLLGQGVQDAVATDIRVRGMERVSAIGQGYGLNVQGGASARVERALIDDSTSFGVFVFGERTLVELRDAVVRGTRSERDLIGSAGVLVRKGANAQIDRVLVDGNDGFGLMAVEDAARLQANDVVVRNTRPGSSAGFPGRGVNVDLDADITLRRVLLALNRGAAAYLGWTTALLQDVTVVDTFPGPDGLGGRGVSIEAFADVTLDRVRVSDCRDVGIFATGPETLVTANDVVVTRTLRRSCEVAACAGREDGVGIAVVGGARLDGRVVAVSHGDGCGLLLTDASATSIPTVDPADVRAHGPGVCVLSEPPRDPAGTIWGLQPVYLEDALPPAPLRAFDGRLPNEEGGE